MQTNLARRSRKLSAQALSGDRIIDRAKKEGRKLNSDFSPVFLFPAPFPLSRVSGSFDSRLAPHR